jgi:RNA polymerase sigma-70 factor (ECF subfamily)
MNDATKFEQQRQMMFSIAYRMLGTVADAEDMVQKAYMRYQAVNAEEIQSHEAFLTTVVTRLCLNHLQLARVQREDYIGTWLPEPLISKTEAPIEKLELHESLSIAFLTLLEQLNPVERAVFLLREIFDYDYATIANILEKEEATCRQLFSRAKKHISENRPRFTPSPDKHHEMLKQFIEAIESGSLENLVNLLSEDVVLWADGGGKARGAVREPLYGREVVARFVLASPRFLDPNLQLQDSIETVNGEECLIIRTEGEIRMVISLSLSEHGVNTIRVMANPDKLNHLNKESDS